MFAALACHCLHKSLHKHTNVRDCKTNPVDLCGKTTVPHSVLDTLPKENPCWQREIFRVWKKGRNISYFSLEQFCLFWITDYIDGFGHSRLETPTLVIKQHAKENLPWAQNESHRVAFLSQIHTYTITLLFASIVLFKYFYLILI